MEKGDRVSYVGKHPELNSEIGTVSLVTKEGYYYVTYDNGIFRPSKEIYLKVLE